MNQHSSYPVLGVISLHSYFFCCQSLCGSNFCSTAPPILLEPPVYPAETAESRWEADLTLMQQAGIHMVRSMSLPEPHGQRRSLLSGLADRAVAAAAKVVFTPLPGVRLHRCSSAWSAQKYPETSGGWRRLVARAARQPPVPPLQPRQIL
jgi:hypothetical protein